MLKVLPVTASVGFVGAILLLLSQLASCASKDSTVTAPISIRASQYWDGNDGPWSSFGMQVGTPSQNVRLMPSSSGNTLWVVLPQGCIVGDPSNCADLRGQEFFINKSSTWSDIGLYQLGLIEESLLGYSGNADFGYDTVTLGWQGDGLPTLNHQVIEGFATKDFYVGTIGLTPHAVNLTTFNDPQLSILGALKNESKIPSSSWAYTAGAYYQSPKVFGSLTLGGYDTTRFVPNNLSISFGADLSRDLLVGIQSITTDTSSSPLLSTGIYALIDSLVPHIWLPSEACQAFEQAFGLVWNDNSKLYLVNDDMHNKLVKQNANVTFKLGPSSTGGSTVDIIMPYRSFDLTASAPLVRNSTRYFPLKRAQNDSQYTLGRTFLQQAYLIVDYDRSNFSVSQALFPSTSVAQNIVSILPPGTSTTVPTNNHKTLSKGAIIGIAVAAIASIIFLVSTTTFFILRRRRKQRAADPRYEKAELDTVRDTDAELDNKDTARDPIGELDTLESRPELAASDSAIGKHEMPDHQVKASVYEMPGAEVPVPELESPPVVTPSTSHAVARSRQDHG